MSSTLGARYTLLFLYHSRESAFDQILMGYVCHIKNWHIALDLPYTYYLGHLSEFKKNCRSNHLIKYVYFHPNGVFMNKPLKKA